jgi:anti-sigma28 factor (negative regulator of flagellin synthesis)
MKTTKAKTTSKTKKTTKARVAVKKNEVAVAKHKPTEEEIRNKAYEIYHQRIARGENGNSSDDWLKAIKLLKDSKQIK